METTNKLDLSQFFGTENYYRTNPLFAPDMMHTDGVQYFADTAGCYWLLDIIATEYLPLTNRHEFQYDFLSIQFVVEGGIGDICVEDGDCKVIKQKHIAHTDCPDGIYKFFLTDNVLMLTSEY